MTYIPHTSLIQTTRIRDFYDFSGGGATAILYDSATSRIYRQHTKPSGGGTSSHYLTYQMQLPDDLRAFPSGAVKVSTYRIGATNSMTLSMFDHGATVDPTVDAVDIRPGGESVWTAFSFTPSGTYNSLEFVFFEITSVIGKDDEHRIADMRLQVEIL